MVRPVAPNHPVSLGYRQRMSSRPSYIHRGIDYACPTGTIVVATKAGTVVYAGRGGGYGPAFGIHVVIRTGNIWHLYAHLSLEQVNVGQKIATGQRIALSGATGNVTGAHLHYQENTEGPPAYRSDRRPEFIYWTEPVVAYPADIFGKAWKLTLPLDGPDSGSAADEVKQPKLATYTSSACKVADDGKSVLFTVHHGGATTSGSKNPRSELREMRPGGLDEITWDGRKGHHRLEVFLSIDHLTVVKPHVVVAQIHDAEDDLTVLRGEGVKGTNRIKMWLTRGDATNAHYLGEVRIGEVFKFAFAVVGGKVRYEWRGKPVDYAIPATAGSYFKVGNYLQSNPTTAPKESTAPYSQVRLYGKPVVSHV